MTFSYAVKASILFWLSSCVVMFVLFGSLSAVLLSAFSWNGSSYHCKALNGDKFVMQGAKLPVETFWGIVVTGTASTLISLILLAVFMVILIVMVYKMTAGTRSRSTSRRVARKKKITEQEKQAKQLEECCTPNEKGKLISAADCDEEVQQQRLPEEVVDESSSAVLSDWTQLSICLVLECVCFLMIFSFFVSWMFVSRDVAFFSSNLAQRFHTTRVNLSCEAPTMWDALDIMCFLGVCSWFLLGLWILGSFLLINRWYNDAAAARLKASFFSSSSRRRSSRLY